MPFSAILMLIITSVVLFGGIAICTYIVIKRKKTAGPENSVSK
jgi:hypothetical protein